MENKKKQEPFNFKKFMKKNWKMIVIIILILFSFNKCTTSCSRNQQIKKLNTEISTKDSIISAQAHDIEIMGIKQDNLNEQLNNEVSHNNDITGIATNNQKDMLNKINKLTAENKALKAEIKKLKEGNGK